MNKTAVLYSYVLLPIIYLIREDILSACLFCLAMEYWCTFALVVFTPELKEFLIWFKNANKKLSMLSESTGNSVHDLSRDFIVYKLRAWFSVTFDCGFVVRSGKHIDIMYYDDQTPHIVRFPKRRRPKPFDSVRDQNGRDVGDEIRKFFGPGDFHAVPTSPNLLGFETLYFSGRKGTLAFSGDEIIKI